MRKLFIIIFVVLGSAVFAGDRSKEARIDLVGFGNEKVAMAIDKCSAGVTVSKASWLKDEIDTRIVASANLSDSWREYTFSFIPKKSGMIDFNLMGNATKKANWIFYDNITIDGAVLVNGDFEDLAKDGKPVNWSIVNDACVVNDSGAQSGKAFIKASHNNRLSQNFKVEEGKLVVVKFWAKFGGPVESK